MRNRRAVLGLLSAAATVPAYAGAIPRAVIDPGEALAAAARRQVGVTTGFDQGYSRIAYPWGDVPGKTGVCADVIIRAVRNAWGLDLQQLVHEDMARDFSAYPHSWGLHHPDTNIDHRRVPNLETYWTRQGARVWRATTPTGGASFPGSLLPGDFLVWRWTSGGPSHVGMIVRGGPMPSIVQNFGAGAREQPLAVMAPLLATARYRWRPTRAAG